MHKNHRHIRFFLLTLGFLFVRQISFAQDTIKFQINIDTTWAFPMGTFISTPISADYIITHSPTKEDSIFYKRHIKLINAEPGKKNHADYYLLACALWELNKLAEAEKMFLKIMASKEPYYVGTSYHPSDIPGDTISNIYGYGSYTSNYKNYACRYLAKIYIEENKFDKALKYVQDADKKFIVVQNCGTGYIWYRGEIENLYGLCYEGLGKYDSIIKMFLPKYAEWDNGRLIRALKKTYSQQQISEYLKIAENSIVCGDTFQALRYESIYDKDNSAESKEVIYTTGVATIKLFDAEIQTPAPVLGNGEKVTREIFVKEFKESVFYNSLVGDY